MTETSVPADAQKDCCSGTPQKDPGALKKDPVCGMIVTPSDTTLTTTHDGHPYYFCSAGCFSKFEADPAKYLGDHPRTKPVAIAGATWTCPMHPEIHREGPGSCPICGMALEPEAPSLDDLPNPELTDFKDPRNRCVDAKHCRWSARAKSRHTAIESRMTGRSQLWTFASAGQDPE